MDDFTTPHTTYPNETLRADWDKLTRRMTSTIVSSHNREGMLIIEHYQPHFWEVESPTGESIAKNWTNEELRRKALERTQKHYTKIYKSEIRRNLAFFSKAPLPTIYRPTLVKGIVSHFGSQRVLDPCVGWGGRLLGTLCLPNTDFTGCEPSSATYRGLTEMSSFVGVAARCRLYNADCLTILPTLPSGVFDLVLTSPPYFDLEVYSTEETQSIRRFPNWKEWVEGFLEPVIRECLRCLNPTGKSVWSVKNIKKYKLRDEVFRIHNELGWRHTDTFGMTATPRNRGGKAKLTEETFVFQSAQ